MTTDESTSGRTGGRDVAEQYWITVARTADLVRQLTALADRAEASIAAGDRQAAPCRPSVALLRATAEAGRELIRSLPPAAFALVEQPAVMVLDRAGRARSRDVDASARDAAAEVRDVRATKRDARIRAVLGDDEIDFSGRFLAACDRDSAAGDRADSLADRRASQRDRDGSPPAMNFTAQAQTYALVTRLEERAIVRQAQGILMERAGLSAGEALKALLLAAIESQAVDDVVDQALHRVLAPQPVPVT